VSSSFSSFRFFFSSLSPPVRNRKERYERWREREGRREQGEKNEAERKKKRKREAKRGGIRTPRVDVLMVIENQI